MPVIIGADEYGGKDVPATMDGFRGNAGRWRDLLPNLKSRGPAPPELAFDDGDIGFRAALRDAHPTARWQRRWIHKTAKATGAMPKDLHDRARSVLDDIRMAGTGMEAEAAFDLSGNSSIMTCSQSPMASSAGGRPKGRSRIGQSLPPSMIFRPSIGSTSGPPIR